MQMTNAQVALAAAVQATVRGQINTTDAALNRAVKFKAWLDAEDEKEEG